MTDEGMYFIGGAFAVYVLAVPLIYHMLEPEDPEEDSSGPIKFALMWPVVALEVIYRICVGEKDNDGTGLN
jgi:hypothetical protein|tara:strand:- start:125 stop:337 length:213 start_codon:yes stop_codon:yes gene_type:complete